MTSTSEPKETVCKVEEMETEVQSAKAEVQQMKPGFKDNIHWLHEERSMATEIDPLLELIEGLLLKDRMHPPGSAIFGLTVFPSLRPGTGELPSTKNREDHSIIPGKATAEHSPVKTETSGFTGQLIAANVKTKPNFDELDKQYRQSVKASDDECRTQKVRAESLQE